MGTQGGPWPIGLSRGLSSLNSRQPIMTKPQFDPPVTWKLSQRDRMIWELFKSSHAKSESKSLLYCCNCSLRSSSRLQSPCIGCTTMHRTWPAAVTMQSKAVQCSSSSLSPRSSLQIPLAPCHLLSGRKQDLTKKRLRLVKKVGLLCLKLPVPPDKDRSAQGNTISAISPSPCCYPCHQHRCHLAGRISDG